jgi:hypothetical protein
MSAGPEKTQRPSGKASEMTIRVSWNNYVEPFKNKRLFEKAFNFKTKLTKIILTYTA